MRECVSVCTEKVGLRNKAVGCSDREVSVLNDSLHFFFTRLQRHICCLKATLAIKAL